MTNLAMADLSHLLLCIGCLLLLAKVVTSCTSRMGLPAVLGEILLGIAIGPTLLGTLFPEASGWIFPVTGETGEVMQNLSRVAVIMLLFVAGMETDLNALRKEGPRVFTTAFGSSSIPFAVGFLMVLSMPALFNTAPDRHLLLAAFVGIALSISALPVIIRILMDLGLYQSRVGLVTVASASVMDILGWTAFTVVLFCLHPFSLQEIGSKLWSHSTLLSFITGIIVGNSPYVHEKVKKVAYGFVIPMVSPLFFLSVGVKVNFVTNWDFALIGTIILVATLSKLTGTFLGARLAGLPGKEALAVGFALNVRGAMEIILSKQALEAGLIQADLFVALVVMAMFTSMMSAPALQAIILNQRNDENSTIRRLRSRPAWDGARTEVS